MSNACTSGWREPVAGAAWAGCVIPYGALNDLHCVVLAGPLPYKALPRARPALSAILVLAILAGCGPSCA